MTDITIGSLGFLKQRVDAAADEQQQQIDALEKLLLNRTSLVNITQEGRKVKLLFTRRGAVHQVEFYADMTVDVAKLRKELIDG